MTTKRKGGGTIRTVSFSGDAIRAIETVMPPGGNFSGFVCRCILQACGESRKMKVAEYNAAWKEADTLARELFGKELVLQ